MVPLRVLEMVGNGGKWTVDDSKITKKWSPIGGVIASDSFTGKFNGNGFSVLNMYINYNFSTRGTSYLIGMFNTFGELKSLGVKNSYIDLSFTNLSTNLSTPDFVTVGVLASMAGPLASNVFVENSAIYLNSNGSFNYVGGLFGNMYSANLQNSYIVNSALRAPAVCTDGGIVGSALNSDNNSSIINSYAYNMLGYSAGIVGDSLNYPAVSNSYHNGTTNGIGIYKNASWFMSDAAVTALGSSYELINGSYPTLISNSENSDSGELICIPSS